MRMFSESGYAKTTMRAIAADAEVSLGNAYYYFASKDHLVQGFYDELQAKHSAAVAGRLDNSTSLGERWRISEHAFLDIAGSFHTFAGKFLSVASDPSSPLSPFSVESKPARDASTAIMREVLTGSVIKADERLYRELPELLWLAHMGIVLYWVHDRSAQQQQTKMLVDRVAPVMERFVALSRFRPFRAPLYQLLDLIADLKGGWAEG